MRVYTDTIGYHEIYAAQHDSSTESPGVSIYELGTTAKARKRKMRHDVSLHGFGARHTRYRNPGTSGGGHDNVFAATWMDWGWFIAVMFRYEPTAIIGEYDGREDFLARTARAAAYKLTGHGQDRSVKNFVRDNAAIWTPGESPFMLVDRLCPPRKLVNLNDRPQVETWLEA